MGRDAMSQEAVREASSRAGKTAAGRGRITGPLSAAGTKAGEMKAAAVRVIKTVRRVRLAALLGINLFIITGAVLDRIAETQLPENESGRGKALVWIHNRLRHRKGPRTKNAA